MENIITIHGDAGIVKESTLDDHEYVFIGDDVHTIGGLIENEYHNLMYYKAFQGHKKLKSINMSDSIKFIGDRAFENCVNLESVCLSKNALRIGNQAFRNCVKLKHFDIYPSLLVLGENCFQGCAALETIRYHGNLHQFRNIAIGISIKNIRIVTDDGSVFI